MAYSVYLSCVNVNSIDSKVSWRLGVYGLGCLCGTLWIYMIFKWRFVRHVHFVVRHEYCSIHDGNGFFVCVGGRFCYRCLQVCSVLYGHMI